MPYVTSTERLARAEGRLLAIREDILDLLAARFSSVPYETRESVTRIADETILRQLMRHAALLPTLDEFHRQTELLLPKETKS